MYVDLFWGSLFCSIDLYDFLWQYYILITIALQNSLKSGSYDASSFDFFLKIALAI